MFIWKGLRHVFMDQADAGDGGSSAGGAGDPAAVGGTGGDAGNVGGAQSTSVLAGAGQTTQPAAIPEKYQVKKEDGSLDVEASSLKLAEAYGHLEKRLGTTGAPPAKAEEYTVTVPDALKDSLNLAEDQSFIDFRSAAHAKGLTQDQFDFVMGKYLEIAPQLVNGAAKLSNDECIAELRKEWASDTQMQAEVDKSYRAMVAYAGDDAEALMNEYGNDPRVIRMMARIGAEMGEDRSVNPGATIPAGQSIESVMSSEAYSNPKHPDHARVSQQVAKYYEALANQQAKSGALPVM